MDVPDALIPDAVVVRLRATAPLSLGLFPEARWTGLLKRLLGEHGDDGRPARWWFSWPRSADPELPAGGECVLTLYALPAAREQLSRLLDGLRRLPMSAPEQTRAGLGPALLFADSHPLANDGPSLRNTVLADASRIAGQRDLRLCLRSPARWLVAAHRQHRGEGRYAHHERDVNVDQLSVWMRETWLSLRRDLGIERIEPPELAAVTMAAELFWTQLQYRNADGRDKPLGGLLGELILRWADGVPATLAPWLALGQYLGCGQRRGFGYGQFAWEDLSGNVLRIEARATDSVLARIATPARLRAAFRLATTDDEDPGADRQTLDDNAREAWIARAVQRWQTGPVEPRALQPATLPKDNGSRELRIPPFLDRVLQRCLLDHLGPAIDPHLAERSYGFRPGRSRMQARDRVLALYESGHRHVIESDVADFFDSVDYWRIAVRLRAFLGVDPLIDQVMAFISAPVATADGTAERERGLPQGAPLSPLLSNLLLDDLDHDLANAGYQMVRYADDFLILARNPNEARSALNLAQVSLAEKGLRLKPEKSRLTSFDSGFSFLGYRFAPGLAVDRRYDSPWVPDPALVEELAELPIEAPDPLNLPSTTLPSADRFGSLVFVSSTGSTLAVRAGRLCLRREGSIEASCPLTEIGAVVLVGRQRLTSGALQGLMGARVPVHVADGRGRWLGATTPWPAPADIDLWIAQRERLADANFALNCARSIVEARVRHQRETLRRRASAADPAIRQLDQLLRRIPRAADLASLRGYEGVAAQHYFECLAQWLPPELSFSGRERRPPRDPFNALLSLGAVILHSHVDLVLRARGLLPTVGFYHQPHGRHATLASDLIEPVRHRAERVALAVVRRGQLRASDFQREANGVARLSPPARRLYIEALEREFAKPSTLLGSDTPGTLHDHLWLQASALALSCRGLGEFSALRYR